jgi:hypothetical protein
MKKKQFLFHKGGSHVHVHTLDHELFHLKQYEVKPMSFEIDSMSDIEEASRDME